MEARELRGQKMAQNVQIVPNSNGWLVPVSNGSGKYRVELDPEKLRCTCPDHEKRGVKCKHIFAVEYTLRAEVTADEQGTETTITETQTVTDGETTVTRTQRKTYRQNWPAYNAAQTNEKRDFLPLLHALCQGVEEPAQTMGRPRMPLADIAFSTVFKVYSTVSTRRFISDLAEAHAKGYISRQPHYNTVCKYLEQEDLTPVLRSLITESSLPLRAIESHFAVDSTAFTTSRFERWFNVRYEHYQSNDVWLEAHLMCGVQTNIVTAVETTGRDVADGPMLPELVDATAKHFVMREVTADKAYSSVTNHNAIAAHGSEVYVPFKTHTPARAAAAPSGRRCGASTPTSGRSS